MKSLKLWFKTNWIECIGTLILLSIFITTFKQINSPWLSVLLFVLALFFLWWVPYKIFGKGNEEITDVAKLDDVMVSIKGEKEEWDNFIKDMDLEGPKTENPEKLSEREAMLLINKTLKNLSGGDPEKTQEYIKMLIQSEYRHRNKPVPSDEELDRLVDEQYKALGAME